MNYFIPFISRFMPTDNPVEPYHNPRENKEVIAFVEEYRLQALAAYDSTKKEWERQSQEYYYNNTEFRKYMSKNAYCYSQPITSVDYL